MLTKLYDYLYEDKKFYRANPCDFGAASLLRPLGRAFALLAGACPCCAGTRLVAAAVLASIYPTATLIALAAALVIATAHEAYKGESDES
jgi:hypothetical protein